MNNERPNTVPTRGEKGKINTSAKRIAFMVATLAAALTAACAAGKNVRDMTLQEYIDTHPGCVQKVPMPSGQAEDITGCQDAFVVAQANAFGGSTHGVPPAWKASSPDNLSTDESYVGRPGYPKLYTPTAGQQEQVWFAHNMMRRQGESRGAFAERVENIARDFIRTQFASFNLSIQDCGVDAGCLTVLLKQAQETFGLMTLFSNQAVAAHDSMGNYITAGKLQAEFGTSTRQFEGLIGTLAAKAGRADARRSGK